jgi:two-component system, LytTR family, sensor kinase
MYVREEAPCFQEFRFASRPEPQPLSTLDSCYAENEFHAPIALRAASNCKMDLAKLRPVARAYLLSIAVWGALSLLTGWQYRIFDEELKINSTLVGMLLLAQSRGFAYALLTPPIFYLVHRYLAGARRRLPYLLVCGLGVAPFMVLYACIRWLVLPPWDAALQRYVPRAEHGPFDLIRSGFADQITIYIAILVAAHAYQYLVKIRKQEVERFEFQRALAASELQALKMQLHPHFLFNTLHGISTLVDGDGQSAKAMLIKLSKLLRSALEHNSWDLIPLGDEVTFAREYLDLEKMRFGTRLSLRWAIAADTQKLLVPHLILQPLVENAVRHGIASSRGDGWVEVAAQRNGNVLQLCVRNSTGGNREPGTGLGLRNTAARLKHLYEEEASFGFRMTGNGAAEARVVIPALGSDGQSRPQPCPDELTLEEVDGASLSRG